MLTEQLFDFLAASPSCYHAVQALAERLERNGYIESFYGDETNGKRRTYYQITENGRNYYREKCEEWKVTKEVVEQFILCRRS